ncbi:MAG: redoxin domain-containing protein [Hyphomicrobiales bacterium]|nr:redoxin domain-containing protein [Hyphomicrobiales bacterium]
MRVSSVMKPVAAVMLALSLSGPALAKPQVGAPAPDFAGVDATGKTWKLSDLRGKIVVLEWTNEGCPYVQKHYKTGNMQALQSAAASAGVVWLTVASSAEGTQGHFTPETAKTFVQNSKAAASAVLLDASGAIGKAFAAEVTPHMYVIDPAGKLAFMGGIDDNPSSDPATVKGAKNYVTAALAELKAGKPVSEAVTRPYGCTVKYKS